MGICRADTIFRSCNTLDTNSLAVGKDRVLRTSDAASSECVIDFSIAVDVSAFTKNLFDEFASFLSRLFGRSRRCFFSFAPIVESAFGNFQDSAHDSYRPMISVCVDPGVLCAYMTSFAKYAVAFFNISFSVLSWAISFRSRLSSFVSSSIRSAVLGSSCWMAFSCHRRTDSVEQPRWLATSAMDCPHSWTSRTAFSRNSFE